MPQVAEFGFGLVTGRKIGGAVQRNRVRRLLREIIRAHRAEIQPGWHLVTIARWRAPEASYHELESDWLHLAKKLGILRKAAPSQPIAPTASAT
ncbi:MAG: ribonuclease P protein component [Verrucomicrobiaceae bacterium]|nr:ribonuclease P protein component [Verrucomicrobiaceae bacterium]